MKRNNGLNIAVKFDTGGPQGWAEGSSHDTDELTITDDVRWIKDESYRVVSHPEYGLGIIVPTETPVETFDHARKRTSELGAIHHRHDKRKKKPDLEELDRKAA